MNTSAQRIIDDINIYEDTLRISLIYPDVEPDTIKKFVIGLVDVRAADDIRISYDKDRDGWVVEQTAISEWCSDDNVCYPDWQEVAFIQAWAGERE